MHERAIELAIENSLVIIVIPPKWTAKLNRFSGRSQFATHKFKSECVPLKCSTVLSVPQLLRKRPYATGFWLKLAFFGAGSDRGKSARSVDIPSLGEMRL